MIKISLFSILMRQCLVRNLKGKHTGVQRRWGRSASWKQLRHWAARPLTPSQRTSGTESPARQAGPEVSAVFMVYKCRRSHQNVPMTSSPLGQCHVRLHTQKSLPRGPWGMLPHGHVGLGACHPTRELICRPTPGCRKRWTTHESGYFKTLSQAPVWFLKELLTNVHSKLLDKEKNEWIRWELLIS